MTVKERKQKPLKPAKRKLSVAESLPKIQEDMKKENIDRMKKMEEIHKEKMHRFEYISTGSTSEEILEINSA